MFNDLLLVNNETTLHSFQKMMIKISLTQVTSNGVILFASLTATIAFLGNLLFQKKTYD